jgi:mRNA interferase RelE/StbE
MAINYKVEFDPAAIADLETLTPSIRDRIIRKINWLAQNFD